MKILQTGQFFGNTNETKTLGSLTLTDTEYTQEKVDWHYHENAYFTFLLDGRVLEGNKKEIYHCTAGALLFHNWQEPHYNIKPKGFTRGFHIEFKPDWFQNFDLNISNLQGSINLYNPQLKALMYNIFKESKQNTGSLAIDTLLIELFTKANKNENRLSRNVPHWVMKIRELLNDDLSYDWSLYNLSKQLDIHPVHLSRDFSKYFGCGIGQYIRAIRVQQSLSMIVKGESSLTAIALDCGFADQSHFIRSFKSLHQITPFAYRKLFSEPR
ncbi:AraC family transcriptional regulator [Pedobacter sp. PACM 27299]|uniref:helix-turn-helix transcriptional regulator n=1 Tax=Pedobacter sp. PACM 27299 TaxID=1727164 RepID=UPI00070610B2|nr:AraC family transcriptional regulator [Pedobacter sp. PACM 27299]ALL06076.1 AraC family transcriptional regulator [Pedobacter sp. PACM 27299]